MEPETQPSNPVVPWGSDEWYPHKDREPVHAWFSLTHAQYLTIPRSVLQAMPREWQSRFVKLLEDLDDTIDWRPGDGTCYRVQLVETDEDGNLTDRVRPDPLMSYRYNNDIEARMKEAPPSPDPVRAFAGKLTEHYQDMASFLEQGGKVGKEGVE